MILNDIKKCKISILGLGYVGLPLALAFAKTKIDNIDNDILKRNVVGFDINKKRINELINNIDVTKEVLLNELENNENLVFTNDERELLSTDVFIVTVPTPVDESKNPDLNNLKKACEIIGKVIKNSNELFNSFTIKEKKSNYF